MTKNVLAEELRQRQYRHLRDGKIDDQIRTLASQEGMPEDEARMFYIETVAENTDQGMLDDYTIDPVTRERIVSECVSKRATEVAKTASEWIAIISVFTRSLHVGHVPEQVIVAALEQANSFAQFEMAMALAVLRKGRWRINSAPVSPPQLTTDSKEGNS